MSASSRELSAAESPRRTARMGGLFWLLTIVTGVFAMVAGGGLAPPRDAVTAAAAVLAHERSLRLAIVSNLLASACYIAATLFVYELLRPVSRSVSLLAAFFSLTGCAIGVVSEMIHLAPVAILRLTGPSGLPTEQSQGLAFVFLRLYLQGSIVGFLFFGLHCLLVGCLVLRSTFMPRAVGVLMAGAGIGWLTLSLTSLLSPMLARSLMPYIALPGFLGESSLSFWLLAMGVNAERWIEQAGIASPRALAASAQP